MLKLNTPIVIHPDTYDCVAIVRCEFDLRVQRCVLYLAPAKSDEQGVYLGVEEQTEEGKELLFPEIIYSVELQQNLNEPDPLIAQLVKGFAQYAEALEQVLVTMQHDPGGLAAQQVQLGTWKWSLACTFEPLAARALGREVRDLRKNPKQSEGEEKNVARVGMRQ